MVNALSIDVEEYFHVHAFRHVIKPSDWETMPSRVEPSTRRILTLLDQVDTKATFFVLGWVAERFPRLIQEIADRGHEIASHGYAHEAVNELGQEGFRRDLQRANAALRSACPNIQIAGYRAPSFSIDRTTPWAFEELRRAGFRYDSSVSPASLHDRYGVRGAARFAHPVGSGLLEIPPSTMRLLGMNFPAVGGGHFRLAPLRISRWAIRRINAEGRPVAAYFHPWEFDPEQPRICNAGWKSTFRHYVNISKTEGRLLRLLSEFRFGRMDEVFDVPLQNPVLTAPEPLQESIA